MEAKVLKNLMAANDDFAQRIRQFRERYGIPMLNMIGGAGCGKTTLLEMTIKWLYPAIKMAVIEGDVATVRDSERIAAAGAESIQINTDGSCHLDANLVLRAMEALDLEAADLLVVENVGNLVCPAEFDIGEDIKIGMLSVPEGDDKPLKYPLLFREAQAVVLSKVDLLPYVRFDRGRFYHDLEQLNGSAEVFEISSLTGHGMQAWLDWVAELGDAKIHLEKVPESIC